MLSRAEVAIGSATIAGGCTWQLAREILELTDSPNDPIWLAVLFAILLGSLAIYGIMMSLMLNEAKDAPQAKSAGATADPRRNCTSSSFAPAMASQCRTRMNNYGPSLALPI
eukprot:m.18693 g.18693  ORF g.18693 m.18693 type:complete len:112 (+) comp5352_c0_seq1:300-635(+)